MLEMTNENFARLLRGLTIAVGNRRNRILLYQFLAAEIRALHCSYGVGDGESYKRALGLILALSLHDKKSRSWRPKRCGAEKLRPGAVAARCALPLRSINAKKLESGLGQTE